MRRRTFIGRGSSPLAAPLGYNLAARLDALRADSRYGSYFSATSDPLAPSGLQPPTAPTTSTNVDVSSISSLNTQASGSARRITLAPGTYSGTISVAGADIELVLTGCTINPTDNSYALQTTRTARRVKVIGGTLTGGRELLGRDIQTYGCEFQCPNTTGSGMFRNTGSLGGHRILEDRSIVRGASNGWFFTGSSIDGLISASCSGTTLTVASVSDGVVLTEEDGAGLGSYLVGVTGGNFVPGTRVEEQLTGTAGGAGTYRLNISQTVGSGNKQLRSRSTNLILANSDIEVPLPPGGNPWPHENPNRFNGVNFGLILDSRMWAAEKFTLRAHADYSIMQPSGVVGFIGVQSEQIGIYANEPGGYGVNPAVETLIVDDWNLYRGTDDDTGGLLSVPRLSLMENISSIVGNGTTATVTFQWAHAIDPSIVVTITNAGGANATGVTLTRTGDLTATYPSSFNGTVNAASIQTARVVVDEFLMYDSTSHSASPGGSEGVAGAGVVPSGYAAPYSGWETVADAAASLASGNVYQAYSAAPDWVFLEENPV